MKNTKEIAKEIRTEIGKLNGVKISVTSDSNHIYVSLIQAPFQAVNDNKIMYGGYSSREEARDFTGNYGVNQYSFNKDQNLTTETKILFNLVEEIIKKYHLDKSDSMTDYFNCAFYYSYSVGRYDKPFVQAWKKQNTGEQGVEPGDPPRNQLK